MPKTLRLSDSEQELLRTKSTEINKKLVEANKQPIKDSELAHLLLIKTIPYARVGRSGDVIFDPD